MRRSRVIHPSAILAECQVSGMEVVQGRLRLAGPYPPLPRSFRGPVRNPPGPEEVYAAVRPYEVMVIFDTSVDEADIRGHVARVIDLVKSRGGKSTNTDYWGRRTLAYEIRHKSDGYYAVLEVLAEPAVVAEADRMLFLEDAVLRHKVIRLPEHIAGRKRSGHRRPPAAAAAAAAAVAPAGAAAPAVPVPAPAVPAPAPAATAASSDVTPEASPVAASVAENAASDLLEDAPSEVVGGELNETEVEN